MTDTSHPPGRNGSVALSRGISFAGAIIAIGVTAAVAAHLVWRNFGSDDFARTTELGALFLYWWACGSVIVVAAFIFALKSARPTPVPTSSVYSRSHRPWASRLRPPTSRQAATALSR